MPDRTLAPTRVDYLLASMGVVLLGSPVFGLVSAVSVRLAASAGSLFAGALMALGLVRYPRRSGSG
ncbi:MAG: hypothetical protein ABEJ82_07665 [Haloplanus sp.]